MEPPHHGAASNLVGQMLKFVGGTGYNFIAEAKPATDVNFDRLNFAVRGLVGFGHMTEFLAVAADNGPTPQGCKPLVRVTQSVDHSLTGLRKQARFSIAL
jgi:hypothetical protein